MAVLDSTFLVDLSRSAPSAVRLLRDLVGRGRPLRVPTVVLMEVAAGTPDPGRAAQDIAASFLVESFDEETAGIAARVGREALRTGRFPGWIDVIIGATALRHGEELISRNERHFRRVRNLSVVTY
ncbi:MAG: PIN domain-containing protein [Euryarchaeota archaeon]|nr:PIN domain-containing protein [Euryarchaeota archaeon]